MGVDILVGGTWLASIGAWTPPTWSHTVDGGCKDASWQMSLPPTFAHPKLRRNQNVTIQLGSEEIWQGVLLEPTPPDDDAPWTFNAQGLSVQAAKCPSLTSGGDTTSTPDTAIDQGIAAGFLTWTRPTSISASPVGSATDPTDGITYLDALLDTQVKATGQWWGVNAKAQAYLMSTPTSPTWYMVAGSGQLGTGDDEYASDLYGRYLGPSGYATAHVSDPAARIYPGPAAYCTDLTPLGPLTSTQATNILNSMLGKGKARLGYTNGVTVGRAQLTTPGGTPASPYMVKGGQGVRMFGLLDEQTLVPQAYTDWTIGETSYTDGDDTLGLDPVGLVQRDLVSLFSLEPAA